MSKTRDGAGILEETMVDFSANEWNKRYLTVIVSREIQKFSEAHSGQINLASASAQRQLATNIVEALAGEIIDVLSRPKFYTTPL